MKWKKFKDGDILVTRMTAPDWVPIMGKAKAIVTDEGGLTCFYVLDYIVLPMYIKICILFSRKACVWKVLRCGR